MDLTEFHRRLDALAGQETGGISEDTARRYRRAVEKFAEWYDGAGEPSIEDFQDYIMARAADEGLQGSTLNLYKCAIKKYLTCQRRAHEYDQLSAWFADTFRVTSSGTPDYLKPDEIAAIRQAAAEDPRDAALVALFLRTGMRVGELCDLDCEDVTLDDGSGEGYVEITREKRGEYVKDRRRLRDYETEMISEYLDVRDEYGPPMAFEDDALFVTSQPSGDGSYRASTTTIRTLTDALAERTAHDSVTPGRLHPHLFRHTVGSILGMAGLSANQIGAYLGKGSDAERYTHFDANAVDDMTSVLDDALTPEGETPPTPDAEEHSDPLDALTDGGV